MLKPGRAKKPVLLGGACAESREERKKNKKEGHRGEGGFIAHRKQKTGFALKRILIKKKTGRKGQSSAKRESSCSL